MCKHAMLFILVVVLLSVCCECKRKKSKTKLENDILEKSEVIMKFPTYALKMPPIITSRKRTSSKVDPLPVSCNSKNVTLSLSSLRKKIKCEPRDTVVEITAPDGSTVTPNVVVVKRCGGMCSGGKKCISSKKENVEFYVRTTQKKSTMVFCSKVSVPEDTECQCGCEVKKECLYNQKFDSNLCKCICTNKEEHQQCLTRPEAKWSSKTCSCGCRQKKICTTGSEWVRSQCRCMKKYEIASIIN